MRVAIMGSGGVGGYYGGLLARAGHDVTFLARGAHLEALQRNGLAVRSLHGDFLLHPVQATDRTEDVGATDWILFCVKTPATEDAARRLFPLMGPETVVTSLQNGIDAAERLGNILGSGRIVGGATWISSALEAPGVIRQVSPFRRVVLGEGDGRLSPRVAERVEALRATGIDAEATNDIRRVLWTKFLFIAAISAVGCLTGLSLGEYRSVPETRRLLRDLMAEGEALARAQAVALEPGVASQTLALVDAADGAIVPSLQRDMAAGRPSELESMIGVLGRMGRSLGIPTPAADMVYAALLPRERRALGRTAP